MGILNLTPDSFYSESRKEGGQEIRQRIADMLDEGATIIDLGGYSSRSGAEYVSPEEERQRLAPALRILRDEYPTAIVSVDTFRGAIAAWAVEEMGADIINDISGYELDAEMLPTILRLQVPYILMHMRGAPETMQQLTDYPQGIALAVLDYFIEKVGELREGGLHDIILDPGFGFAKTIDQNYELLSAMDKIERVMGLPWLAGISRKSMIYKFLGNTAETALNGTTVLNTLALERGSKILRVHDVRAAREAIQLWQKTKSSELSEESYYTFINRALW